ncbi:class F sortase [Streptomyces sp. HNM0663]|uniref:Class F sortase n=1 Tax=Streptomyces chengmaiensis TaxID=3040919 RepID=A0ABT6HP01_9ACTN|nr:class F sortase [Streptomyces chengmaiensis]MDH2390448.1 class F sortase [Streptomyces chengmaiensis]
MPLPTTLLRARLLAAAGLVAVAALAGCSAPQDDPRPPAKPTATHAVVPDHEAADPAHLAIPSLGVQSALMRLGLNADGTVEVPPPEKGMTAGWYTGLAKPGETGPAVIIGHNDTRYGRAVFHDLKKIAKGADIAVRDARGRTVHFTVTAKQTVSKKAFPTQKVYGATDAPVLRLVTCDGGYDAEGHPVDNLIVYAEVTR